MTGLTASIPPHPSYIPTHWSAPSSSAYFLLDTPHSCLSTQVKHLWLTTVWHTGWSRPKSDFFSLWDILFHSVSLDFWFFWLGITCTLTHYPQVIIWKFVGFMCILHVPKKYKIYTRTHTKSEFCFIDGKLEKSENSNWSEHSEIIRST